MGDERTNEVYLDDVFVPDEYVVGEVNHGFQYISEALDLERFTMFTFSPIEQRLELLVEYVKTTVRDGRPLKDDPVIRQRLAQLATQARGGTRDRPQVRLRIGQGWCGPDGMGLGVQALCHRALQAPGQRVDGHRRPGEPAAVKTAEAPMAGRAESTYRYTVIDTIGGGASEIQKNIIARRKLGLPKNF